MERIAIAVIVFFTSNWCHALNEQCLKLSQKEAQKSQQIINQQIINHQNQVFKNIPVIDYYCGHCLDQYVRPIVIDNIIIEKKGSHWELLINGKVQNIAYLYVENNNMGHQVGCSPQAVSRIISF